MRGKHCKGGSRVVTLDELKNVVTPEPLGPRHKPIPHYDIVSGLHTIIENSDYEISKESLAVGRAREKGGRVWEDTTLTATLDIVSKRGQEEQEEGMSLGLISSNVMERSVQIMCGARVFVCDNLMLTGDTIMLNKKHTLNLNLNLEIERGFDLFIDKEITVRREIELLKEQIVTDREADRFFYQLFVQKVLPTKFLHPIHETYYSDEQEEVNQYRGRAWGLHNACTRVFRGLPLHQKIQQTQAITTPFKILNS